VQADAFACPNGGFVMKQVRLSVPNLQCAGVARGVHSPVAQVTEDVHVLVNALLEVVSLRRRHRRLQKRLGRVAAPTNRLVLGFGCVEWCKG
jgi:hypothetical protein